MQELALSCAAEWRLTHSGARGGSCITPTAAFNTSILRFIEIGMQSSQRASRSVDPPTNPTSTGNGRRGERSPCSHFRCQPKKYHLRRARIRRRTPMRSVFCPFLSVYFVYSRKMTFCFPRPLPEAAIAVRGGSDFLGIRIERQLRRIREQRIAYRKRNGGAVLRDRAVEFFNRQRRRTERVPCSHCQLPTKERRTHTRGNSRRKRFKRLFPFVSVCFVSSNAVNALHHSPPKLAHQRASRSRRASSARRSGRGGNPCRCRSCRDRWAGATADPIRFRSARRARSRVG